MGLLSNHWIVSGSLKYAWFSQSGREQLFDLARDPHELKDCAADPAYQEALVRLRGYLIDELGRRGDGYSDGCHLIVGNDPSPLLPFMQSCVTPARVPSAAPTVAK